MPDGARQADNGDSDSLSERMLSAWASGRPAVLMFSTPGCPYCHALRTEHLNGLERNQAVRGILYLELDLNDRRPIALAGDPLFAPVLSDVSSGRDLARKLSVRVAPTVLFLGPTGELAERLVGYGMRDFYAAYLDQRIGESIQRLRRPG
jgi:thioredoxin-related protein